MRNFVNIAFFFCIVLCHSCSEPSYNLFLQDKEYKLWYIDNDDKDFSRHIVQYDTMHIRNEEELAYLMNETLSDENYRSMIQDYRKSRKNPDFLYMDRDGYACVLTLDRDIENFVEKSDSEMTGFYQLKNDSVFLLNGIRFLYKGIGNAITLTNTQTGETTKIIDSNLPQNMRTSLDRSSHTNIHSHYERWGSEMAKSPLLQGHEYKLWRIEGVSERNYLPYHIHAVYGGDIQIRYLEYCYFTFVYFDNYGLTAYIYLPGNEWRFNDVFFSEENRNYDYYHAFEYGNSITDYWYPANQDTVYVGSNRMEVISCEHEDTIDTRNMDTGKELRYISVNLPPKSKQDFAGFSQRVLSCN